MVAWREGVCSNGLANFRCKRPKHIWDCLQISLPMLIRLKKVFNFYPPPWNRKKTYGMRELLNLKLICSISLNIRNAIWLWSPGTPCETSDLPDRNFVGVTQLFMAIILCLKNNHINQKPASKPSIRWCKLQLIYTLLYLQTPEISLLLNQFFVIHFFCLSKLSRYKL